MKIRLVNVNPTEALPIIELVEEASTSLNFEKFTLVLLKGSNTLRKELREAWTPEAENFYALHIALNAPTVYVRLDVEDRGLLRSSIYHELGHAILHGSPRYYRIPIPPSLMKLGSLAPHVLYLLSIAVKDFEVSRLLARKKLSNTQKPLLREMLRPEQIPWNSLGKDELILALASSLKSIMFSIPLVNERVIESSLRIPNQFLQMALAISREMGEDTIGNIRLASKKFTEFVRSITFM